MAKQLSMEDLLKKYKFLTSDRQTSLRLDTSPKTHETDRTLDKECSKSSLLSNDGKEASGRLMSSSNTPIESSSSSSPLTSEDTCKVCLDAAANCVFIECGHIVTCLNCAKVLTRCPVCRETIKRTLRIYKS